MDLAILIVGGWLVCGIASSVIASSKGRDGCSWALAGFLLGPIGVLMAIGVTSRQDEVPPASAMRKGPMCAEMVRREAIKCRYCGAELTPLPSAEPPQVSGQATGDYNQRFINCSGCNRGRPKEGSIKVGRKYYCGECAVRLGLQPPPSM